MSLLTPRLLCSAAVLMYLAVVSALSPSLAGRAVAPM